MRANLALFHVVYSHLQQPQGNTSSAPIGICMQSLTPVNGVAQAAELCTKVISTFVFDGATLRAQGFELEVSAAPSRGLLLGGSASYSGNKYTFVDPIVLANNGPSHQYLLIDRPAWTASVFASYETEPVFAGATLQLRADGLYQSSQLFQPLAIQDFVYANGSNANAAGTGSYWLLNSRVSLRHLKIGGADAELALWGKNLTDRENAAFALPIGPLATSANLIPPRTYGVELSVDF